MITTVYMKAEKGKDESVEISSEEFFAVLSSNWQFCQAEVYGECELDEDQHPSYSGFSFVRGETKYFCQLEYKTS